MIILPDGYRQLEYIESTGTQYIDTLYAPNENTKIVIDVELIENNTAESTNTFFGTRTSASSKACGLHWNANAGTLNFFYNDGYAQANYTAKPARLEITLDKNVLLFDDITLTRTYTAFQCDYPLLLSAFNIAGTADWMAKQKLYSCQIYDNGTLVRNYVPCINPSGTAGLYDLVNDVFYGNAGTGAFIAGPEVYGNDKNTLFLLHGDSIADASQNNTPITNNGVSVSTAQSKFSGKSLYLNGASYLDVITNTFIEANSDFTVDWWQYKENTGTFACLNPWRDGVGYSQFLLQHGGGTKLYSAYNDGDSWGAISGADAFVQETGVWVHWAIVKKGTTLTTYRNGTKYWSGTVANNYGNNISGLLLGCHAAANNRDYFKGYVDELRVSNIARWSSDFAVPTKEYSIQIVAPATPENLKFTSTKNSITLTWSASQNAEGYYVYKKGVLIANVSGTTYTDDFSPAVDSEYSVSAYNEYGISEPVTLVINAFEPPEPVTGLVMDFADFSSILLEWEASVGSSQYKIYRDNILISTTTGLSFLDNGLTKLTEYNYAISAINNVGESEKTFLIAETTDFVLITDRTAVDVQRLQELIAKGPSMTEEEMTEWLSHMKGAYNARDLNRVEKAVLYVIERLKIAGWFLVAQTKTNWQMTDFPTLLEMQRYLNNVRLLRSALPVGMPEIPLDTDKLKFDEANTIEQVLEMLDAAVTNIMLNVYYSNEIYSGEV